MRDPYLRNNGGALLPLGDMAEPKGLEPSASGVTGRRYNRLNYGSAWWAVQGSNLRPPPCEGGALPAELTALEEAVYICHPLCCQRKIPSRLLFFWRQNRFIFLAHNFIWIHKSHQVPPPPPPNILQKVRSLLVCGSCVECVNPARAAHGEQARRTRQSSSHDRRYRPRPGILLSAEHQRHAPACQQHRRVLRNGTIP